MKPKILIFITCIALASCYPLKKAHKQGAKWIAAFPVDAAKTTRSTFPCVPRETPTIYVSDSAAYQDVLLSIQTELFQQQQTNDSLKSVIALQVAVNPQQDTICKTYELALTELYNQNQKLIYRLNHIPPVINTVTLPPVIDKADVIACEDSRDKAIETANAETKERKLWQHKGLVRWWTCFGLIFLIVGWLAANIYFKSKK